MAGRAGRAPPARVAPSRRYTSKESGRFPGKGEQRNRGTKGTRRPYTSKGSVMRWWLVDELRRLVRQAKWERHVSAMRRNRWWN